MPQTFVVLQCAFCHAYQVTLDKASKKFCCAICSQKQSFKTLHAISNSAKDCRRVVQELNTLRGALDHHLGSDDGAAQAHAGVHAGEQASDARRSAPQAVEWDTFAEQDELQTYDCDERCSGQFVTSLPDNTTARTSKKRKATAAADQDEQPDKQTSQCCGALSSSGSNSRSVNGRQQCTLSRPTACSLKQHWQLNIQPSNSGQASTYMQPAQVLCMNSSNENLPPVGTSRCSSSCSRPKHEQQQPWCIGPAAAAGSALPVPQHVQQQKGWHQQQEQCCAQQGPCGANAYKNGSLQDLGQHGQHSGRSSTHQQHAAYQQSQVQRPPVLTTAAEQQLLQQQAQNQPKPAAVASAWGAFVDDENAAAAVSSDEEGDVDEQGFCCLQTSEAVHLPDWASTGAATKWGS